MNERTRQEAESISDPVERADVRRNTEGEGDVHVRRDGKVEQRPHGNMDPTLTPKGKDFPDEGPFEPEHDKKVPDVDPNAAPRSKDDLSA